MTRESHCEGMGWTLRTSRFDVVEDADLGDIRREMRQKRYEEATGRPLAAD